jgi:hypothetical protein
MNNKPTNQKGTLVIVIQKRLIDLRRKQIADHAAEARQLYDAGKLPHGTFKDLMADLDQEVEV